MLAKTRKLVSQHIARYYLPVRLKWAKLTLGRIDVIEGAKPIKSTTYDFSINMTVSTYTYPVSGGVQGCYNNAKRRLLMLKVFLRFRLLDQNVGYSRAFRNIGACAQRSTLQMRSFRLSGCGVYMKRSVHGEISRRIYY